MKNRIYEHLKTTKKYNTLKMKYEMLEEDYENKVIEYNELKRQLVVARNTWEEKLKEQEKEIIKLKKRGVKNVSNTNNASTKVSRKKKKNN